MKHTRLRWGHRSFHVLCRPSVSSAPILAANEKPELALDHAIMLRLYVQAVGDEVCPPDKQPRVARSHLAAWPFPSISSTQRLDVTDPCGMRWLGLTEWTRQTREHARVCRYKLSAVKCARRNVTHSTGYCIWRRDRQLPVLWRLVAPFCLTHRISRELELTARSERRCAYLHFVYPTSLRRIRPGGVFLPGPCRQQMRCARRNTHRTRPQLA